MFGQARGLLFGGQRGKSKSCAGKQEAPARPPAPPTPKVKRLGLRAGGAQAAPSNESSSSSGYLSNSLGANLSSGRRRLSESINQDYSSNLSGQNIGHDEGKSARLQACAAGERSESRAHRQVANPRLDVGQQAERQHWKRSQSQEAALVSLRGHNFYHENCYNENSAEMEPDTDDNNNSRPPAMVPMMIDDDDDDELGLDVEEEEEVDEVGERRPGLLDQLEQLEQAGDFCQFEPLSSLGARSQLSLELELEQLEQLEQHELRRRQLLDRRRQRLRLRRQLAEQSQLLIDGHTSAGQMSWRRRQAHSLAGELSERASLGRPAAGGESFDFAPESRNQNQLVSLLQARPNFSQHDQGEQVAAAAAAALANSQRLQLARTKRMLITAGQLNNQPQFYKQQPFDFQPPLDQIGRQQQRQPVSALYSLANNPHPYRLHDCQPFGAKQEFGSELDAMQQVGSPTAAAAHLHHHNNHQSSYGNHHHQHQHQHSQVKRSKSAQQQQQQQQQASSQPALANFNLKQQQQQLGTAPIGQLAPLHKSASSQSVSALVMQQQQHLPAHELQQQLLVPTAAMRRTPVPPPPNSGTNNNNNPSATLGCCGRMAKFLLFLTNAMFWVSF